MSTTIDTEALAERLSAKVLEALDDDPEVQALTVDDVADLLQISDEVLKLAMAKVSDRVHVKARDVEGAAEDDPAVADRYGPPPSPDEMRRVHARQAARVQATIDRVAARSLSRADAAKRLGVSPQSVSDRKKAGALSAIRRGREWLFPSWQFHDDATLPGLAQVMAAWPGSPLALAEWAEHPAVDLGGRTPAQALAAGDIDAVLLLEQAIAAATW